MPVKKLFDVCQREVIVFYLRWLPNKGEYSIFSQRKQILKEMRKRGKHRKRCNILLLYNLSQVCLLYYFEPL